MSQLTLKITQHENEKAIEITLEGRVAGPWVAELSRVWVEAAPYLSSRELILDIRNVTYADRAGTDALKAIYAQSRARLITGSPWTKYLAESVRNGKLNNGNEEVEHA